MLKFLIVEDGASKADDLRTAIGSIVDGPCEIVVAADIRTAKLELTASHFDALMLDIQLPLRQGEPINAQGGKRLLEEVLASDSLKRPSYIVGMTDYSESFVDAEPVFQRNLFAIVQRSADSEQWKQQISGFVRHVVAAVQLRTEPLQDGGYKVSLAIVCALDDPELAALTRLPMHWTDITGTSCNPTFEGYIANASGRHRIVATSALEMGMPAAAALCAKTIERFRPRFIAMTGIAGGLKDDTNFGDIIAADVCWDYSGGKISEKDGVAVLESEPRTAEIDPNLKAQFQRMSQDLSLLGLLVGGYTGERPAITPGVQIGPLFTGTHVVASTVRVQELVSMNRKVKAIDMEGYGVFAAARYAEHPRPLPVVVKGVSDFADPEKADKWRPFASHTSAAFLMEWARRYL